MRESGKNKQTRPRSRARHEVGESPVGDGNCFGRVCFDCAYFPVSVLSDSYALDPRHAHLEGCEETNVLFELGFLTGVDFHRLTR